MKTPLGRRLSLAWALASFCMLPGNSGLAAAITAPPPQPAEASPEPPPRVYLFRGFAGVVFSRGTDQMGRELEQAGAQVAVNEAYMCGSMENQAIRDYRRSAARIVLIGHSVGAACALGFAKALDAEHIPLSLIVTFDPARIARDVPANVERYINIFQSNSLLGGRDVAPGPDFHGFFASYDLVEQSGISHMNIEKQTSIQDQVVSKIAALAATPAKGETDARPLHLVVPADAPVELWDAGMPVAVRPGDTLQTLAAAYHAPLWSLEQINDLAEDAVLSPEQQVVVPYHLGAVAPPQAASHRAK